MEVDLSAQAVGLLRSAALGFAGGVPYDLLRPLRYRLRPLPALLCDAFFCLLLGAASFALAMSAGSGRLGTVALCAGLAAFLLYLNGISPLCRTGISKLIQKIRKLPHFEQLSKNISQKKKNNA
jgi:hypothetical protein